MQWALVLLRNNRKNKMRDSSNSLCILHGMGTYAFLHFQCATSEYGVSFFRTKKRSGKTSLGGKEKNVTTVREVHAMNIICMNAQNQPESIQYILYIRINEHTPWYTLLLQNETKKNSIQFFQISGIHHYIMIDWILFFLLKITEMYLKSSGNNCWHN